MTQAKQMVINEIQGWPDDKVNILFQIIQEIDILANISGTDKREKSKEKAFDTLEALKKDFQRDFGPDFDPDKELSEGLESKYGRID